MAVFRVEKTKDFTIMSNHHLRNTELSLKAKGLLSLMLSLPEDWDYTTKGLAHICKDGVDSITTALKELERHGYLTRQRLRYDIAVMGPSGSGKTTLLNIISGFLSADSGSVMIGAENMLHTDKNKQAEIRSSILGFIFQDFMLINGLTVRENIYLPQIIGKKDNAEMDQKTQNLLDTFGIAEIAEKYPNELSGGQKQRVAVARALSNTPLLILADEPTGNLDSKSSAAVIESFLLAKEKMNATILMVTHDAIAASYADRVVALSDGKIVKELLRTVEPRQFMNEILDFLKVVEVSR